MLKFDKFLFMAKYKTKLKRNITGKDITSKIEIIDFKLNTPILISYNNRYFKIAGTNYINQRECSWKCSNIRKIIKNLPKQKFCNCTIKGQRDDVEINKFKFYLKYDHSDLCNEFYQNNNNIKNKIRKNLEDINEEEKNEDTILTKEDFEKKLKTFIIDNKSNNLNLSDFIKY